jgi:Invasin, domain 3
MRVSLRCFSRIPVSLLGLAIWACGGGDLVLPGDGGPDGEGGTEPSATQSTVSAEPASIRAGTGTSTVVVVVRDGEGNPVEGASVTLQATGDGNALNQPSGMTGPDGTAAGTLQSSTPGDKVISAMVNGSVAVSQTALVTVTPAPPGRGDVDRLVFLVPPRDVREDETFSVEVALVDSMGSVVPLSGLYIYVGLFEEGDETPTNDDLRGERFENTQNGIAVFNLAVEEEGRYRLRALTDDLPELGPHGPEPYLYSEVFEVD